MTDVRVAAAISVHGGRPELRVPEFVALLSTIDTLYVELQEEYDATTDVPVDPLMLNDADFGDTAALEEFVADLEADGILDDVPPADRPRSSRAVDPELQIEQFDRARPMFVELTGEPTLLLVLWLLNRLDGVYKVTEEYSLAGPDETNVHKRVSFTTQASLPEITDVLRQRID